MRAETPLSKHRYPTKLQLQHQRAYCVSCPLCAADPGINCTSDTGRSRSKPHADRVARSNGLKATPRMGQYARPRDGLTFTEAEIKAFQALDLEIPT